MATIIIIKGSKFLMDILKSIPKEISGDVVECIEIITTFVFLPGDDDIKEMLRNYLNHVCSHCTEMDCPLKATIHATLQK